jgi:fibronectin-binding autotransporter adhesin
MALISNGHRLSCNPCRNLFGVGTTTTLTSVHRGSFTRKGALNNFYAGEATVISGASIANKNGFPTGAANPISWILPIKAGGLAARRTILAEGDLTAAIAGGKNAEATIAGVGDLTATGALIISLQAAIAGSGDITGAALLAFLNLAAALSGEGGVDAQLTAIGHLAAAIEAEGTVAGTTVLTALGTLAADITVTGDVLTTGNVANAILDAVNGVEDGLTVRHALRLIAAATAGKISGASTTTITIRNAYVDDKDRIIATVDGDGNRSAITYDLTDS